MILVFSKNKRIFTCTSWDSFGIEGSLRDGYSFEGFVDTLDWTEGNKVVDFWFPGEDEP